MQKHVKLYMDYFGYDISDTILCEVCGAVGVDIAHLNGRKMGGDPQGKKDVISNLVCLCRSCHYKLDFSMELSKEFVQARHDEHLKKFDCSKYIREGDSCTLNNNCRYPNCNFKKVAK